MENERIAACFRCGFRLLFKLLLMSVLFGEFRYSKQISDETFSVETDLGLFFDGMDTKRLRTEVRRP